MLVGVVVRMFWVDFLVIGLGVVGWGVVRVVVVRFFSVSSRVRESCFFMLVSLMVVFVVDSLCKF